ncbi:LIC12162 family protein [Nitrospinae bacterium]|nr:LIC12162 family protein [Nitrospinota bacterium]
MFLITTADQRFWKAGEDVLFLGEWCKIYSQRHIWSKMNYKTLPYHWDDREKFYRDFLFADQLYEHCLPMLSDRLNKIHNVTHSTRYWRFIVGPWLFKLIGVLYDRYLSICEAEKSQKVTNVLLPNPNSTDWVARDYSEFSYRIDNSDPFNQYLYSEIIRFSGNLFYETIDTPVSNPCKAPGSGLKKFPVKVVKKILYSFSRLVPKKINRVIFVQSHIRPIELACLQLSIGTVPNPGPPLISPKKTVVDPKVRKGLVMHLGRGSFEELLSKIIPVQIPTVYLEGYSDMRKKALKVYPKKPKLIYTTNAVYGDEGFKFWAAEKLNSQTKLITSQHGGGYGIMKFSSFEKHKIKLSDRTFTWGWDQTFTWEWEESNSSRLVPMASGQLISRTKNLKANMKGNILWLGMCIPRYFSNFFSQAVGPQVTNYLMDQKRFADSISDEVRSLLKYAIYPSDYNWGQKERLAEMCPSVKVCKGGGDFYKKLNEARLCIATYNATTYLETFSANFPTLVFWNPEYWELRPSAQPYFDELREVEILHDTPESAASKANQIFRNPLAWWQSAAVQKVRKRFCNQYARTSPNWVSEWGAEIKKLNEEEIFSE